MPFPYPGTAFLNKSRIIQGDSRILQQCIATRCLGLPEALKPALQTMNEGIQVDWSELHSVEEMQQLSNLGHWIEGGLFAIIAIIALLQAYGVIKTPLLWQSIILIAGLFLIGFLIFHHGFNKLPLVWSLLIKDPQQRQHLLIAALLSVAGLALIAGKMRDISFLNYSWPLALLIIGIMFLVHEQHGTNEAVQWAQKIHRYLGIILIAVAVFNVFSILFSHQYRWLSYVWPILLAITAIFLLLYREPKGAYEQHNMKGNEMEKPHH